MNLDVYFEDLHITNLVELGQNMYLYPNLAFSLILRDDFQEALRQEEPLIYQRFEELKDIEDDDIFVFKVSYLFCPYMTLRYHKYRFDKLEDLGNKMINFGPTIDVYLEDLLKNHLISYVFELQGLNTISKESYRYIKEAERLYLTNRTRAYFKLAFNLSKLNVLVYNGRAYVNPKSFLEAMTNDVNITKFALEFEENDYFFAWLDYLGYQKRIERFYNLVNYIDERK